MTSNTQYAQNQGIGAVANFNANVAGFQYAMRASGLEPPEVIYPGKFYRFPGLNKSKGNNASWCLMFDNGIGGCFGDWSSNTSELWFAKEFKKLSRYERERIISKSRELGQEFNTRIEHRHQRIAEKAASIVRRSRPSCQNHEYLLNKCISPHAVKSYKGLLVLEIIDFSWNTCSLQFISSKGTKTMLKGGRKRGCFIHVAGDAQSFSFIIICEGWATGCSLSENEPEALVLAAIDAGNLKHVAIATRAKWPDAKIVIAGDDDRLSAGNPGATKAHSAALAAKALIILPTWPKASPPHLTDFNDLAKWMKGGVE